MCPNRFSQTYPGMGPASAGVGRWQPYVRHCGFSTRGAWAMGERCLLDYLLVYLDKGEGHYSIGDRSWPAEAGDLIWIPPGEPNCMQGFAPLNDLVYIHFDLLYRPEVSHWDFSIPVGTLDLSEFGSLMHPHVDEPEIRALTGRIRSFNNQRAGDLMKEICLEVSRAQPFFGLRASGLLLQVLSELLRGRQEMGGEQFGLMPAIETAGDYLREHCHRDVTVVEAARRAGVSASYFRKLFALHYDCSPRTYLRKARIQKAKELMSQPGLNLTEIAECCGFSTVHSLSKAFHAMEGISPSAYRRHGVSLTRVEGRRPGYAY